MPKNPNSRSRQGKRDEPMSGAMKFFLAGCVAELYLLIIRRFYVNGTLEQVVAWDTYLKVLAAVGAVIFVVGAVLSYLWRADRKKRVIGWAAAGAGVFLALSGLFIRSYYSSALTFLCVLVLAAMLLGVLWCLYDRECSVSLTILGVSLIVLWVCLRELNSQYLGTAVRVIAVVYLALIVLLALLVKRQKLRFLLPADADPLPVYLACGLSALAVIAALVYVSAAYYAMWALAIVVFALAVYYTVKQL